MPPERSMFPVLGFMQTMNAARDFGLDPAVASAIAARFNPRAPSYEHLVEALADALIERGAVRIPDTAL